MAKLTKFAKNGNPRELALIKDTSGNNATTPEEALTNLCDAHFPGSTILNINKINSYFPTLFFSHRKGTIIDLRGLIIKFKFLKLY